MRQLDRGLAASGGPDERSRVGSGRRRTCHPAGSGPIENSSDADYSKQKIAGGRLGNYSLRPWEHDRNAKTGRRQNWRAGAAEAHSGAVIVSCGKVAFVRGLRGRLAAPSHLPGFPVLAALAALATRAGHVLSAQMGRSGLAISLGPPCHLLVRKFV